MEYLDYQDNNNVIMKVQGEIQIDLINDDNNRKMMKWFSDFDITDSKLFSFDILILNRETERRYQNCSRISRRW